VIQGAKIGKHDLEVVVWVDLANAYWSVPHSVIEYAMRHYWVPERLRKIVQECYHKFVMRFSSKSFITDWQSLDVGIPMGCTISPLLFALVIEMVIQESEPVVKGPGHELTTTTSVYG